MGVVGACTTLPAAAQSPPQLACLQCSWAALAEVQPPLTAAVLLLRCVWGGGLLPSLPVPPPLLLLGPPLKPYGHCTLSLRQGGRLQPHRR